MREGMQGRIRERVCACVKQHIQTVSSLEGAFLSCHFVEEYGEDRCRELCGTIEDYGVAGSIQKLSEEGKRYLMEDPDFLGSLKQIRMEGGKNTYWRMDRLLSRARGDCLSKLDYGDIREVLVDETISADLQYPYLNYFMPEHLAGEEKERVLAGLEKFQREIRIKLSELSQKERKLIGHPLFVTGLLDGLLNQESTWEMLTWPGVLPLLEKIYSIDPRQRLWDTQFHQIVEAAEEIQALLEQVLPCFEEEQQVLLIRRWMENERLLYDLKCLARMLPDMGKKEKEELLGSRAAYVLTLYEIRLDNIHLEELSTGQTQVLIYAVLSGKKHFLNLINEHSDAFRKLGYFSLLLDPYVYRRFLNLNTVNEKNLRDAAGLPTIHDRCRQYLKRPSYTFEELRTLTTRDPVYFRLYGLLTNERSDDRLRVLKELLKREALPSRMDEEKLEALAARLSAKPLSGWMGNELGHIRELKTDTAIELLTDWELYKSYIPNLVNGRQAAYLIRNQDLLPKYKTFGELHEHLIEEDLNWAWLRKYLGITDAFVKQHERAVYQFVSWGDAQIVYEFCQGMGQKLEEVRRLLTAHLMGEFEKVKYYRGDLEKEISYPVGQRTEELWKKNRSRKEGRYRAWEEDRFIPLLQIGEIPRATCLSYRDGEYKECLLSCFDANKKVIYLEEDGKIVFRAMLRLTKGSSDRKPMKKKKVEFADLTREEEREGTAPAKEDLILFLERPYISGLSTSREENAVSCVYHLVQEKAGELGARLIISKDYDRYDVFARYQCKNYYVYISASKNGEQYLDSLGGMAAVSSSGSYESGAFLLPGRAEADAA